MDMLAQAALQNQTLNFSTIMKLYNSSSLAEKQRMVEKNEQELIERQQQAQQQQLQVQIVPLLQQITVPIVLISLIHLKVQFLQLSQVQVLQQIVLLTIHTMLQHLVQFLNLHSVV